MEVTVEKRLSGLGFSFLISDIVPGEESVARIRRLFSCQSEESSPLMEGDIILAVNGESVKGLSYQVQCFVYKYTKNEGDDHFSSPPFSKITYIYCVCQRIRGILNPM